MKAKVTMLSVSTVLTLSASMYAPSAFAANSSAPQVTLTFATNELGSVGPMTQPTTALLKQFEAQNPNVHIQLSEAPGTDLQTLIQMDFASNKVPDIFNFWRPEPAFNMDKYIASGELANLTSLYDDPKVKKEFPASAWHTATVGGKVWGIPLNNFYIPFVVNTAVFAKAKLPLPTTWNLLVSDVKALKAKGFIPWATSTMSSGQAEDRLMDYVLDRELGNQAALNLFAGKGSFTSPKVEKALSDFVTLAANSVAPDASSLDPNAVVAKYYNTGKAAMFISNSNYLGVASKSVLATSRSVAFPVVPGGAEKVPYTEKDLTGLFYAGAQGFNDPVKGPYIAKLIEYLTSPKAEQMYANFGVSVPAVTVKYNPIIMGKTLAQAESLQESEPGNKWLGVPRNATINLQFYPLLGQIYAGSINAEQFAQQLQAMFH